VAAAKVYNELGGYCDGDMVKLFLISMGNIEIENKIFIPY
jgi:hypothetical protein